jgi:histidinol phosphatase-like enzyme
LHRRFAGEFARLGAPFDGIYACLHGPDDGACSCAKPRPGLALQAARELARMGPAAREAVPTLVRAIEDDDARVAEEAARALGEIRDRLK